MASRSRLKSFRHVKKIIKELDILWHPARGKGSHGSFIGLNQKTKARNTFPLPRNQQHEINIDYFRALRRRFGLNDKEWDNFFD